MLVSGDPLIELGEARTYLQKTPVGKFPVKIAVVLSEDYGDRYACVKVEFNKNKPVVYELAVTGDKVVVEYTEKKNLNKPKGAPLGFVTYNTAKTITVIVPKKLEL